MATVAPPADQAANLLKNLSLDSQSKTLEIPEPTKKSLANGQNRPLDRSVTPLIPDYMDPTVAYFPNNYASGYYHGGYGGATNDWDDYSKYVQPDGVYGDMYHGYGYAPYGPYSPAGSPVPTVTHDGQLYGGQHFQYPSPYLQPINPTAGPYSSAAILPKGENAPPPTADQPYLAVNSTNGVSGTTGSIFNANGSYRSGSQNGLQNPRYNLGNGQAKNNSNISPVTFGNGVASRNQNVRSHVMSPRPVSGANTNGNVNQLYANKLYNQYGMDYRSFYGYDATDNKYKPRGRGNGFFLYNDNGDGLNELNRGPRTRSVTSQNILSPITLAVKGENIALTPTDNVEKEPEVIEKVGSTPNREQYNQPDFPDTYEDAKFFVIKSYSEDDVHKSIKYNVWASTQNGNKKLDAAYQEAQQKPGSCPVFLFFSVNTSGQFVGVAEMVGPVDFDKSLEYWQQDKWMGCFPVKWHIVKDLPNSLLKHITLENNENKPVTNSRDTQEVKLEQGLQVMKIFKEESNKQCVLDDFDFYEDRQRKIQERKAKQQQLQKQFWEGKAREGIKVEVVPTKSSEVPHEPVKETTSAHLNGDLKATENKITVNGVVANGC